MSNSWMKGFILAASLFALFAGAQAALAVTSPGCQSGVMTHDDDGPGPNPPTFVAFLCTATDCPQQCTQTQPDPNAPPGVMHELDCYCGIGSPDNVCGRQVFWWVSHIGLIISDARCEGPCPEEQDCEEDPLYIGSGYTTTWCACQ